MRPEIGELQVPDVVPVQPDRPAAVLQIVVAHQQIDQRGLSGSGRSYNGYTLSRMNLKRDVPKYIPVVAVVSEPDIVKLNTPFHIVQRDRTLCLLDRKSTRLNSSHV